MPLFARTIIFKTCCRRALRPQWGTFLPSSPCLVALWPILTTPLFRFHYTLFCTDSSGKSDRWLYRVMRHGSRGSVNMPSTSRVFVVVMWFVVKATVSSAANRTINLGLVTPLTGKTGFLQVAAASTMGVETAKANGYLNGTDIM